MQSLRLPQNCLLCDGTNIGRKTAKTRFSLTSGWIDTMTTSLQNNERQAIATKDDWFDVLKITDYLVAISEPRHFEHTVIYLLLGSERAILIDTGCGIGNLRRVVEHERRAILFARNAADIEARIQAGEVAWPNHPSDWFEARVWIWLHYAATKLARGELYEAIGMLAFFREQVLGPLLHRRAGKNQRGVRRLETLPLDEHGMLAATVAANDASSVQRATEACIDIYMDLRSDDPPLHPTKGLPGLPLDFIDKATSANPAGPQ
jgi:hypothetical protein